MHELVSPAALNARTAVRRRFVTVHERQVHLRHVGVGDPVILLHESPRSSLSLVELAVSLGERFSVLALDTPGYGDSDPLALERPDIPDFADALAETMTALGLDRAAVYGSHTGAHIALELARRHPTRVTTAVLDGLLVLDDDERRDLLANSLPGFPPTISGGHLAALWTRYRDQHLFYPWHRREPATRLDVDMPDAENLHEGVMDMLRAGPGYAVAHAAAFRHVVGPALGELAIPVAIVARDDDVLAPHLGRIASVPACVTVERLARDRAAWARRIGDLVEAHADGIEAPAVPPARDVPQGLTRDYVDTGYGQLRVHRAGNPAKRPLLMLHASPGSAAMLLPLAKELARDRRVVALDTLGNGDSDKPPWTEGRIDDYAPVVAEVLEAMQLGPVDVYGTHTGAFIAAELAIQRPELVRRMVLDGVGLFTDAERRDLLEHYTPRFSPRDDGTHLLSAWSALRDQTLFWPWFNRTRAGIRWVEAVDAERLHAWYVELLKSGDTYPIAYRAAFSYPTRERLPELAAPTLMVAQIGDMLHANTMEAAAIAQRARAETAPSDDAGLAALVAGFLDEPEGYSRGVGNAPAR